MCTLVSPSKIWPKKLRTLHGRIREPCNDCDTGHPHAAVNVNDSLLQAAERPAAPAGLTVFLTVRESTATATRPGQGWFQRDVLIVELGGGVLYLSLLAAQDGIIDGKSTTTEDTLLEWDYSDSQKVGWVTAQMKRKHKVISGNRGAMYALPLCW